MHEDKPEIKAKKPYSHVETIHATLKCKTVYFNMDEDATDEFIRFAGSALREAFIDNDYILTIFRREGFDGVAKIFQERFEKDKYDFGVEMGDFGEVVAHIILQDHFEYCIPIMKIRYKTNWKKSSFGVDIVSFNLCDQDPSKDTVIFSEVKASKTKAYGVEDVFNEITKLVEEGQSISNQKMRNAIRFISERLHEQKDVELEKRLYRFIDCYSNPDYIETFTPILVRDKDTWNDDALECITITKPEPNKLTLCIFTINDLEDVCEATYLEAKNWSEDERGK